MSNKVIDALTQLEKAIGLEPLVIPANIAELVTPRKFTGTEFLKYVGEEYAKQRNLPVEKAAIQRDYLAGMIALAKMSYISDGATQAPFPTVQDYTKEAMVAWRAYQVRLEPVAPNPANAGTPARAYKAADGAPEPLTIDVLREAFSKMLKEADLPGVVAAVVGPEVVKAMASLTAEPEVAETVVQPEVPQTVVASVETPESATDHWAGL